MKNRKLAIALLFTIALATMGGTLTRQNDVQLGDDTGGTAKILRFGPNGQVSWSGSKMQVSNDGGLNNTDIGGGAGGAAGINILVTKNADMEKVTAGKPSDWTESAGVLATEAVNVHDGAAAASWDAAASADTLVSDAVTIDANEFGGLKGENCVLIAYYLATTISSGDVKMEAVDGSSNVLNTIDLEPTDADTWRKAQITFPCPFGTTLKAEFEATTNADAVLIDSVFLGRYDLIDISQATVVGTITWAGTTNCIWNQSVSSWTDLPLDNDCPAPTVTGSVSAPGTKVPAVVVNSYRKDSVYSFVATGGFSKANAGDAVPGFRFHDGTLSGGNNAFYIPTDQSAIGAIWGTFEPATDQSNVQVIIQSIDSAAGLTNLYNDNTTIHELKITVYRYPKESQQAIKADTNPLLWEGTHSGASACGSWSVTSTSYADFPGDADCDLTQKENINFGTVVSTDSGGNETPGLVWTPKKIGTYMIFAKVQTSYAILNSNVQYALTDGSNNILDDNHRRTTATVPGLSEVAVDLVGFLPVTNLSAKTLKIRAKSASGSTTIFGILALTSHIRWKIIEVTGQLPAPLLVGAVTNPFAGVKKTCTFHIANSGTPSETADDGCVNTLDDDGPGLIGMNWEAGFWSAAPRCACTTYSSAAGQPTYLTFTAALDTTSMETKVLTHDGTVQDDDFYCACWANN
jgi:hypothetical protein